MKGVGETVVSYLPIVTQDDDTDVVSLEVKSHSTDSGFEFTISPAWTLVRPKTLAIPSPMEMTDPNSFKSFYTIVG